MPMIPGETVSIDTTFLRRRIASLERAVEGIETQEDRDDPADQLLDFEEAVRESTIPFLVEARDWARLPQRFHRVIEREYVVVVRR